MQTNDYTTISELGYVADNLPEAFQSSDFSNNEILPPGNYTTPAREITVREQIDRKTGIKTGHLTFLITFKGGLTDENGRAWGRGGFEKTYASTKPFARPNLPGKTSQAAEYLSACGFNPKDMGANIEAVKSAMIESQNVPVQVYVGREEKVEKDENGNYPKSVLKTQDFNIGTREEPVWATSVVKDGKTFTARHKFGGFRKVR